MKSLHSAISILKTNIGVGFPIMTAYINAIGLFGSLLTTIGFIQGNIPSEADPAGATVRIKGEVKLSQITTSIFILEEDGH